MKFLKNKLAVTIIVLSVAISGIIMYTINNDSKDIVSGNVGGVIASIQKGVYKVNNKIKGTMDFFLNFSEVKEQNQELVKKNVELENKLLEYDKFKGENERLREILNFKDSKSNYTYLGCNIIGYSGGNLNAGYVIDRGESDGLKKGMAVIATKGLVGQVTSTGPNWSIVQSLINENIAVSVMVNTTRETAGILKGYKDSQDNKLAKVTNLPLNSEVKKGDVILTSGLGGIYPKEIRVGEVLSVETDNVKVMKTAVIQPYVDFNKLEELFVIIPKETREIKYEN